MPSLAPTQLPTFAPYELASLYSTLRFRGLHVSAFDGDMVEAFKKSLVRNLYMLDFPSQVQNVVAETATGSALNASRRRMTPSGGGGGDFLSSAGGGVMELGRKGAERESGGGSGGGIGGGSGGGSGGAASALSSSSSSSSSSLSLSSSSSRERRLGLAAINITLPALPGAHPNPNATCSKNVTCYHIGTDVEIKWRTAGDDGDLSCEVDIKVYEYDAASGSRLDSTVTLIAAGVATTGAFTHYIWDTSTTPEVSAGNYYQLFLYCSMSRFDYSVPFYFYTTPSPTPAPTPRPTESAKPTVVPTPSPTSLGTDVSFMLSVRLSGFRPRSLRRRLLGDFDGNTTDLRDAYNALVNSGSFQHNLTTTLANFSNVSSAVFANVTSEIAVPASIDSIVVDYTRYPTEVPTHLPTSVPTLAPTSAPTAGPTLGPTALPSLGPSAAPTRAPTLQPSGAPTLTPSLAPTGQPSLAPSPVPSRLPTWSPTSLPTGVNGRYPTPAPSLVPSGHPTSSPTLAPSPSPSLAPTALPSLAPSLAPSSAPTLAPTAPPTLQPSLEPSPAPSLRPTGVPSLTPTLSPTDLPLLSPTPVPTLAPTPGPTALPTIQPSSSIPTLLPTSLPVPKPTPAPSPPPTPSPTLETSFHMVASTSMVLSGIGSVSDWTSDHERAFKQGLVNTTTLLTSTSDITEVQVTATSTRRRQRRLSGASKGRRRTTKGDEQRNLASDDGLKVDFTIDVNMNDHGYTLGAATSADDFAKALLEGFTTVLVTDLDSSNSEFVRVIARITGDSVVVESHNVVNMIDSLRTYFANVNSGLDPSPQPTPLPTPLFGRVHGSANAGADVIFTYVGGGVLAVIICLCGARLGPKAVNTFNEARGKKKWTGKVQPVLRELDVVPGHSGTRRTMRVKGSFDKHLERTRANHLGQHNSKKARIARLVLEQEAGEVLWNEY